MTESMPPRPRKTLDRQIRFGMSWNAANLLFNKGMSILVRLVLARMLVPEQFGLVAMIVVVLGLVMIFADFGLQNALIQRKRDESSLLRFDSAFWLLLGGGIGLTLLFVIAGIPLMIWFYDEPKLSELAAVMSISILLHALSILPTVRLTRRMRFKSQVIADLVSTLVASFLAIALVFAGMGVWALAVQQVSTIGIKTAMLWRAASWRPRWRFSWASLRDVAGFSGWMLGSQLVYYARTNLDNLVIGILLGAYTLGIYAIAYLITESFRVQLTRIISTLMLPVYSKLQSNIEEIKPHYLSVTRMMTLIVFPTSLVIFLFSEELITNLLGVQWKDAAVPAQILALCGAVYAISGPAPEVLQGIGKVRTLFLISLSTFLLVAVPSMVGLTSMYGLVGSAFAMLLSGAAVRVLSHLALKKYLGIAEREILKAVFPALVIGGACYLVIMWFQVHWLPAAIIIMTAYLIAIAVLIKGKFR